MPDQKTYTADDFAAAQFAEHPDGRIASRADKTNTLSWLASAKIGFDWCTDDEMAESGWSPVTEQKITVADEMVDAAHRSLIAHHGYGRIIRSEVREALTAALDAAPTTDEGPIDYKVLFGREEARAEKAERERDEAQKAAEFRKVLLDKQQDVLDSYASMSAREHLDAVWEAAYVPKDGAIPKGSSIITRSDHGDGDVRLRTLEATGRDLPDPGEALDDPRYGPRCGQETRLLDPPAPKRPEWLDAPAVCAWHKDDGRTEHDGTPGVKRIWSPDYRTTDTWSTPSLRNVPWSDLVDVEPLGISEEQP